MNNTETPNIYSNNNAMSQNLMGINGTLGTNTSNQLLSSLGLNLNNPNLMNINQNNNSANYNLLDQKSLTATINDSTSNVATSSGSITAQTTQPSHVQNNSTNITALNDATAKAAKSLSLRDNVLFNPLMSILSASSHEFDTTKVFTNEKKDANNTSHDVNPDVNLKNLPDYTVLLNYIDQERIKLQNMLDTLLTHASQIRTILPNEPVYHSNKIESSMQQAKQLVQKHFPQSTMNNNINGNGNMSNNPNTAPYASTFLLPPMNNINTGIMVNGVANDELNELHARKRARMNSIPLVNNNNNMLNFDNNNLNLNNLNNLNNAALLALASSGKINNLNDLQNQLNTLNNGNQANNLNQLLNISNLLNQQQQQQHQQHPQQNPSYLDLARLALQVNNPRMNFQGLNNMNLLNAATNPMLLSQAVQQQSYLQPTQPVNPTPPAPSTQTTGKSKRIMLGRGAVEILNKWLFDHFSHPYPNDQEKSALAQATGLTIKQVNYWFINARVRIWRPLLKAANENPNGGGTDANTAAALASLGPGISAETATATAAAAVSSGVLPEPHRKGEEPSNKQTSDKKLPSPDTTENTTPTTTASATTPATTIDTTPATSTEATSSAAT